MRICDLASIDVSWGYQHIWIKIRDAGQLMNRKLVYRLYREDGLAIRANKPCQHSSCSTRIPPPQAGRPDESRAMAFVAGELCDVRRFRLLKIIDDFTRESLAVVVGESGLIPSIEPFCACSDYAVDRTSGFGRQRRQWSLQPAGGLRNGFSTASHLPRWRALIAACDSLRSHTRC